MRGLLPTLVTIWTLGLAGVSHADVLITHIAVKVGERPSTVGEHQMPQSSLAAYSDMPISHLETGSPSGGLSATSGSSAFALSSMSSDLREETAGLLTQLNAQQQDDGSILVALPGDVLFDFDKSDIRADAKPVLDQLITVLTNYASPEVDVSGHTDSKGSVAYNQTLSEQRAAAVSAYLASRGIDERNLTTVGKGESDPVAPNEKADGQDDPEGRQANRRVEFKITPPEVEQ